MKSEEEIKKQLEILREIKTIVHPSLFILCEWILEVGDKKEQEFLLSIWKGILDAHRRAHPK